MCLLYFTSTTPHTCMLPQCTFNNWYQSRWEAGTVPQGRRGHVLRLRSNLVSTESGVRSADGPVGLSRSQILNLGSFRVPFSPRKSITGYFDDSRFAAAGSAFFCRFGSFDQQVAGSTGVQTGEYRLKTLYYRLQVKICRFCTLQILLSYMHFLMYKILWV